MRTVLGILSIAFLLMISDGCASIADLEKLQTKVNLLQQQIDIDSSVSASANEAAMLYEYKATQAKATAIMNEHKLQDTRAKLDPIICRKSIYRKHKNSKYRKLI